MANNKYQFDCGECPYGFVESVFVDFVEKVTRHHRNCEGTKSMFKTFVPESKSKQGKRSTMGEPDIYGDTFRD